MGRYIERALDEVEVAWDASCCAPGEGEPRCPFRDHLRACRAQA